MRSQYCLLPMPEKLLTVISVFRRQVSPNAMHAHRPPSLNYFPTPPFAPPSPKRAALAVHQPALAADMDIAVVHTHAADIHAALPDSSLLLVHTQVVVAGTLRRTVRHILRTQAAEESAERIPQRCPAACTNPHLVVVAVAAGYRARVDRGAERVLATSA